MYKYILILMLTLIGTGCTGISKVKDRYHKAPFEKEIEKGEYKFSDTEQKFNIILSFEI